MLHLLACEDLDDPHSNERAREQHEGPQPHDVRVATRNLLSALQDSEEDHKEEEYKRFDLGCTDLRFPRGKSSFSRRPHRHGGALGTAHSNWSPHHHRLQHRRRPNA